jgi:DNA phosphorothioation-dependent restriction protein DptH
MTTTMWTDLHAAILKRSVDQILNAGQDGSVAFIRCLAPDIVEQLAGTGSFAPDGWQVYRVADAASSESRTITADQAVELRENKKQAILLLVDTDLAGAGMDGIYSAAREVAEAELFDKALRLAARQITKNLSRDARQYAESAVKIARGHGGRRHSISKWTEFDFYVRVAAKRCHPGELLFILGLWPAVSESGEIDAGELLVCRTFVDQLLSSAVAGMTPMSRIDALRLLSPTAQQVEDLERFIRDATTRPITTALKYLDGHKDLWVNALRMESSAQELQEIQLVSWRTRGGKLARWSGLIEGDGDAPPELVLRADADQTGEYSKLEVRWTTRPADLEKNAVQYRVAIVTELDEELAAREVTHGAKREEKCRFSNDDFMMLSEDALISAKVVVSAAGHSDVEAQESDEFIIRFGEPPERQHAGVGKKLRCFSEGLIEFDDREEVIRLASLCDPLPVDSKGYVLLRTAGRGKSYRVYRPALLEEIEDCWCEQAGAIGRWRLAVRASGARAGAAEFIPHDLNSEDQDTLPLWERAQSASRRMAERFSSCGGGVGQVYDEKGKIFDTITKEYLLAWSALLEHKETSPSAALANTVEVQSLSGRTIGLIVLPSHALRVAWHVAYDNLVLHAAFESGATPKEIREECAALDGAMFPAFLPGVDSQGTFVFADTLGFHTVGMIPDTDREPKAAVAILARALAGTENADAAPTVGQQSASVLGTEILKYLDSHRTAKLLHVHALRAGDGLTVARALGRVHERHRAPEDVESEAEPELASPAFVLEMYPSSEQRAIAGRFIAEAREKRRSGAGTVSNEDQWMLESLSLPGGVHLPRLRWARKSDAAPKSAAHVAVAFDTFESSVRPIPTTSLANGRPYHAFGLLSFFERKFTCEPTPAWESVIPPNTGGEKHPSDRLHTERLLKLELAVQSCVSRSLGHPDQQVMLTTEISPEKAIGLRDIHRLCDWVITLDRNAGIEYFDSPRDNKDIYDAYVIDCVPEREDLGCLQLITSTSNLDEVRTLLDAALDQMGLSRSRRNAEFLMNHLKALSGRLAIRLTGHKAATSELIALAMSHAQCQAADEGDDCWMTLSNGFIIPVDDVRDLLPPLATDSKDGEVRDTRPDLIYVSAIPRKGITFRFAEIKYRRHLRAARNPDCLESIRCQVESLRDRWITWYGAEDVCGTFRAVRRAKLARVLRFYADKARRHYLNAEYHDDLCAEIERFIEKGADYKIPMFERMDRGWVFCPEYAGHQPLEITPAEWGTRIFLFGPGLLPDLTAGNGPVLSMDSNAEPIETTAHTARPPETIPEASISNETPQDNPPEQVPPQVNASDEKSGHQIVDVKLGTDLLSSSDVRWQITIKGNPHLLIAGLPGMGKTTCLINACRQMLDSSIVPIVFSYHQDIDERLEEIVGSIRYIDFRGLGFNPLQVLDRKSRMAYLDVAGAIRDIFAAIFPELGELQGEQIRKAIKDSFIENGWNNADATLEDLPEPSFGRFVEILRDVPKPDRGLKNLLARLEELADYGFFSMGEAQESLWASEQVVVVRVHATQNDNLQKAFASLIFYGMYKDMFRRGIQNRVTHAVIFDEAHRAAKLTLIPTMAKECRKYGISLVLASQEARDFNISLFSAIANYLVLRLTEADAKALVRNVASSDQERVLIDRIKQMDRFKALYFCEGKKRPSQVALQS